jgi:hypothetical protein
MLLVCRLALARVEFAELLAGWGCTMMPVRRISAILMMALFSFSLIGEALFASDADSKLQACCLRDGKHHCTMTASQSESSSGPAVQAVRCPFFPTPKAGPASRTVSLPGISQTIFAGLVSHPAARPQTEALSRISYSRAAQKRGPPPFSA